MEENIKEVLNIRIYKAGYVVKTMVIDGSKFGCSDFTMKSAYTPEGAYIGTPRWAHRLCKARGIKPELRNETSKTCSIGFCEADQKWYGWSHRAMCGFEVGSEVKPGDCAFVPSNREEYIQSIIDWYRDDMYANLRINVVDSGDDPGIYITYQILIEKTGELGPLQELVEPLDIPYGHGAWTAQTLEDAKQMAIDFAESVS